MQKKIMLILGILLISAAAVSALSARADYVTIYPGEEGRISINLDNDQDFNVENIVFSLNLDNLPFTTVGTSAREIDEIKDGDDDDISFVLVPSLSATPTDYNIPYTVSYLEEDADERTQKEGSFGLRVGARTDLDFSVETSETPILNKQGELSLEIINRGLGDLKSVTVTIMPEGFELISNYKYFVGTVDSDDTEVAQFDVVYRSKTPSLKAKVEYKDFENTDQVKVVTIPFGVYSEEEAMKLGLITKSNTGIYVGVVILIIIAFFVYRKIKKKRKNNKKNSH